MVMPPARVPWLLLMRLLAISRLCPHAWTKMPPPPWELFAIDNPSIRDGLHWKLLGNGFGLLALLELPVPVPPPQSDSTLVRSVVPSGKAPAKVSVKGLAPWK